LDNARVAGSRAEGLAVPGAFDAITARALATLPAILAVGGHLLGPNGRLLAMKGARPDAEIAMLPPGWRLQAVHVLAVPGLAAERHLVVVGRDRAAA
ncbi:MAG: RsmG family class I SAM-dependent methyltransferase, partial [Luteimonas sp.]